MSITSFGNKEMLLIRLLSAIKQGKRLAILVGSGLTLPDYDNGQIGVSSVREIISDIREFFKINDSEDLLDESLRSSKSLSEEYQISMQTLLTCFGQDELNKVIVRAVLNAMTNKAVINSEKDIDFKTLEKETENWHLRSGTNALGELYVDFNEKFAGPILTSNFDPLIEVSIRKHGGNPNSIFIVNDGKFLNQFTDNVQSVVHFHGYWHGSDTLHTVDQLRRERPQLRGDLKSLLHNSVLLVIGYGGWNDIFTNALLNLVSEGNNNFDVLWCFYENEEDAITSNYKYLLSQIYNSLGQRVVLYKGIDCNYIFPSILKRLNASGATIKDEKHESVKEMEDDSVKEDIESFSCDIPPNNFIWVGRKKELTLLSDANYKTCFITGFGGQGKSGLASHYIKNIVANDNRFELWDWRDCKEEDHKFQTIIISQIERLSKGKYRSSKLANATAAELVDLFFKILGDRKIVFAYDNVDKYIDLEEFKPIGGFLKLFQEANRLSHNSIFIFTCRPHINYTDNNFLEISLKEISKEETQLLFIQYNPPINDIQLDKIALKAHQLTNGHPLWLNLIAAQSRRGLEIVNTFLNSYQQHNVSDRNIPSYSLAENTLDIVWKSLNYKQQTLLRGLAEMVTALYKEELQEIFNSELSINQFNKSFNALDSLNLLVIKSQEGRKDLFELHPLVKEYILYKYKLNERSKFITLFVNFYDQLIVLIKPKLNANSPLTYFEKYTQKAELQVNSSDFKKALLSLHEISDVIHAAGYTEEYLRVGILLFDTIDWLKAVTEEYTYFDDQFAVFVKMLTEKGKFEEVEVYLKKYIEVIPGKSISYINYCNLKTYYNWFKGEFYLAIEWAEKGLELTRHTGVGSNNDIENNLALALRDTKNPANIERALSLFLRGENLEDLLNPKIESVHFSSPYFGNIGRCLFFQGRIDEALICYFKSFDILKSEKISSTIMNLGYASLWIFEALLCRQQSFDAINFLKFCLINWEKVAPIKAMSVRRDYDSVLNENNNIKILSSLSNWEVETFCKNFVEANLNSF